MKDMIRKGKEKESWSSGNDTKCLATRAITKGPTVLSISMSTYHAPPNREIWKAKKSESHVGANANEGGKRVAKKSVTNL